MQRHLVRLETPDHKTTVMITDGTWTISFSDGGVLISIPVAVIDGTYIDHVRARSEAP